ncbi:hypothetical protein LTR36_003553 [Oleoguttula mirabilis]|uniref:Uncharacterized protein n=1 Tax=Oleoguttula mirabilis TaxID=1507867 RepID=A0AAV9JJN6_9PEZI|nr:hypothetical protein LTR36_003553 [Oleoguttula mirabilis]
MDKLKGVAKGGWKPAGDRPIHRETWKSDLKGIATGKKKDPYEEQRNHQSSPLTSLRDPDSFGPPPKHNAYYGSNAAAASPSQPAAPTGGLGSPVPAPRPRQQEAVEEEPRRPPEPYRKDTSGLRTDNLPKPPVRRANGGAESPARTASPSLPPRTASPSLPPRQTPSLPARQATKPPPSLPPRMTEHPDEFTPPPPPTYGEATSRSPEAGMINQGAANRLAQAGVSVPGFGIGAPSAPSQSPATPSAPQLSELQQRFSRMNAGAQSQTSPAQSSAAGSAAAHKKPAPPPPPKKTSLNAGSRPQSGSGPPAPPPLPLSSKPKPTG